MHELSIADSIIKTTLKIAEDKNATRISAVGLRIGELTDIVNDSLSFGFEILTKGTIAEKSKLEIEQIPIEGKCLDCNNVSTLARYHFVCTTCNSRDIKLISGDELDITYVTIETDDDLHE